jgi:GntR family transcriptional regulator
MVERTTRDVNGTRSTYQGDHYRVASELHFDAASG